MKKNFKTKKSFTIVETLVTLLAITIMLAGPLTFMYKSYKFAEIVKVRIMAAGLSQEGLELATALRNDNLADFIIAADACASGCMADWDGESTKPTFVPCVDTGCQLYGISGDPTTLYRSSLVGTNPTGFYRSVKFTQNGTQSYTVESIAWSDVEGIRIESNLKKLLFRIEIDPS